jgi:formylmethanofuran dehydrogenase subunit D
MEAGRKRSDPGKRHYLFKRRVSAENRRFITNIYRRALVSSMEEVTLQVVKRAMPGHGRARIHSSLLTTLGISDKDEIEVVASGGTSVTLTAFADKMVEEGKIRISGDDLKKLKISDGDQVTVRRKIPVGEQVKTAATGAAGKVTKGVKELGDTVSEKTSGLEKGTKKAARDISSKAKEVSAKIADELAPIGEKISEAGKDTAAKIQELVPTGRFSKAVEAGLKQLDPADSAELKKVLAHTKGDIHAVVVGQAASGRSIGNLTVPPDVTIAAVQRGGTRITPAPDLTLLPGDLVYMTGKLKGLDYMTTVLEG